MYSSSLGSIAVDTIIAASLCTLLLMSRTGTRKTNSVITLLMAFSINTGLLTSIVTLASFIAYAVWPQRFVFMGIYFTISKLYINSVLASLNARTAIRSAEESDFDMSFGMTTTNRRVHTDIAFPKRGEISSQPGISESETSIPELEISESKEFGSATGSESISV
ncbi:hypothetical protein D9613_010892 [Agrocybe pediades]|uniref:DUF6534 domain-containing protein n=1 Tax=Agrocybe pediades TaxID=84607 RepID=A0A8H4QME3_9AGAR|nr:hypothetical protein D9613_010892 [Agrocybe pediades]